MTAWQAIAGEQRMLYSPVGLRLVDDFTGDAPFGRVRLRLDRRTASGAWEETTVEGIRTPSDTIIYPGLGRSAHVGTAPIDRYRARIEADHLLPYYLRDLDAIEFDAPPWDHENPPAPPTTAAFTVFLVPGPSYPFPSWIRVLRGTVIGPGGGPVAYAEVTDGGNERVLTDQRGSFALPLRWAAPSGNLAILASDLRTGAAGQITVNLPVDLTGAHQIPIN
jgi:hypothetical protein